MARLLHASIRRFMRAGAPTAWALALAAASAATEVQACTPGAEACPVVLKMKPGAKAIKASGTVSGAHPNYYFKFEAGVGQKMTIHIVGGNIKTGPGIPITFPDGKGDAVDVDTPYTLPATGAYVIVLHANTMSSGPFGRFTMTLQIK
jgi:hypothetical protein